MRVAQFLALLSGVEALLGDRLATSDACHAPCQATECTRPSAAYHKILSTQAACRDWKEDGGYCGSFSIQRAAMTKGAWISQQQVRDHTVPGGGHDNEILETNIDLALRNLKLRAEAFDYEHTPVPQVDAYRAWMKRQLVAGNPLVVMIMFNGSSYPVYPGIPYGLYSHIQPFVGIMSSHPLTDEQVYDDDYVIHYTDWDLNTYYRSMASLPGDYDTEVTCPWNYFGYPCINKNYGFGWAITGLQDKHEGFPLSLSVDPASEPDLPAGEAPLGLTATLTIQGLTAGLTYQIYRWDSVVAAFDYNSPEKTVYLLTAPNSTAVYTDPKAVPSNGTTYYRCTAFEESLV